MKVILSYISHIVSVLLVLVVCLFSGCQKSVVPKEHETANEDYISFGGKADGDYDVKSGDGTTPHLVTTELLKKEPFGVFGYKSFDDKTGFTDVFSSSNAQKVSWDETLNENKGAWTYTPKQKWTRSMYYRFRAVWPYKPENIQTGSSANCLSVTYSSFVEDYDLMVAYATRYPLGDPEGVGQVALTFKHALAGLRFKIKFADIVTESDGIYPLGQLFYGFGLETNGTKVNEGGTETGATKVDDGRILWKCSDNTFSVSPQFHWQSTQTGEAAKPFGGGSHAVANVYFTETPAGTTGATSADGAALIVPQTLSSKEGMETYVNFYTENGGSALHRAELPYTELKPGKIYTFTLTIKDPQITINVDIQNWKEINSNIDIIL